MADLTADQFVSKLETAHDDLVSVLSQLSEVQDQELGDVIQQADGTNDQKLRELELIIDRIINKADSAQASAQNLSEFFLTLD